MLGDCHAHVIMDGKNYKEAVARHKNGVDESVIHNCFRKYLNAGVTFVRDGGDAYGVSKRAKELAPEYGITYLTPIFAIHKAGSYGGIVGRSFENLAEYHGLVKDVKALGGDFIKVMLSGLIDFENYGVLTEGGRSPKMVKEMIRIAHEEGMAVMAHCNGSDTMLLAAGCGVDSIEHGAYANTETIYEMIKNGVIWTPTVSPMGNLKGGGRFDDEITEKITANHLENIRTFAKNGGRVALGSDAGAWRVPHVEGLKTELTYLKPIVGELHLAATEKKVREKFSRRN